MNRLDQITPIHKFLLLVLRFCIGWHLFYQGVGKFLAVNWTSRGYLENSTGPFSEIFHWIVGNPSLLAMADAGTKWGLVILGLGLMLGLFTRLSALGGFALLMLFYLASPALVSDGFVVQAAEGTELYVNKTLIEALALSVILAFPTGQIAGLDILVRHWKTRGLRGKN